MPPLDVFEEHGEIAALWGTRLYDGRTVVCFDRHLDLKPLVPGGEELLMAALADERDLAGVVRKQPIRGVAGAFGLDDFWTAASLAGQVKRLVWVPSWSSRPGWHASALSAVSLIATSGESPEAVARECCLRVHLCGIELHVVPWNLLGVHAREHIVADVAVDIDLDWLVDEHGQVEHPPSRLAALVTMLGGEVTSMTWSTRSGFLPKEFRNVSVCVARELGHSTTLSSYLPETPWPEGLLLDVHRGAPADPWLRSEAELCTSAPGVAQALLGLLVVRTDPVAGKRYYDEAVSCGYTSSWLAYKLGISRYAEGAMSEARSWLCRAIVTDPRDTLAMHARVLLGRSRIEHQEPGLALAEFRALAADLPLRQGVWSTVDLLARQVGDEGSREEARAALASIDRLLRCDVAEELST